MQYQHILLFIDISVIVLILVVFKDYYWRRLLIIATVCAYVLAAILPYLLVWTSLNQTILFYTLAMGAILLLGYYQYKSMESRRNSETVTEVASKGEVSTNGVINVPAGTDSVGQSEKQPTDAKAAPEENDSIVEDEPVNSDNTEYIETEVSSPDGTIADLKTGHEDKAVDTGSGLESPSASDTAPADITQPQDSAGDDQLTVTAEEQPGVTVQPSIVKAEEERTPPPEEPSIVGEEAQPTVTVEEPPVVTTEEKPTVAADESSTGVDGDKPAVSDEVSLNPAGEEPMTVTTEKQMAVVTDEQPAFVDEMVLSGAADKQPAVNAEEKPTDDPVVEEPEKPWEFLSLESETTVVDPVTEDMEYPNIDEAVAVDVQVSIEDLITKAFEARASGNYFVTLTILETILEQDPPEEIVNLILDDVEVLFAKLAP